MNSSKSFIPIEESNISFGYLKKFNIAMGVLHLIQGLLMVFLGTVLDFKRDLYTFYLKYEFTDRLTILPDPQIFYRIVEVGPWIGSFLLMSALAHFLIAFPLYNRYVEGLKNYINEVRWFEYAFSSSVMVVLISILFGIWSFWLLFAIFVSNALMNMFGLLMEKLNQNREKVDWTPYILGWIAGAVPWIIIIAFFYNTAVTIDAARIPTFVYIIFIVEFIIFNSFAINMFLQYKKVGPWKDYLYGERGYQILSLVAKTLLAWLVFGGLFQPE